MTVRVCILLYLCICASLLTEEDDEYNPRPKWAKALTLTGIDYSTHKDMHMHIL